MKKLIIVLLMLNFYNFSNCEECYKEIEIIKKMKEKGNHYEIINKLSELKSECYNGFIENYIYYYAWASKDKRLEEIVAKRLLNYYYYNNLNLAEQMGFYCLYKNNNKCLNIIFEKVNKKEEIPNLIVEYYIKNKEFDKVIDFLKEFPYSESRISRELMVSYFAIGNKEKAKELSLKIFNNLYYPQGFKEEKLLTKLLAEKILFPDKENIQKEIEKNCKNLPGLYEKYLNYLRLIEEKIE